MTKIFPEIKQLSECVIEKTKKHLKHDEVQICQRLVNKYNQDYTKMAKDLKINYLQWSKGQCEKFVKLFQEKN